jgi:hypothetical protein
VFNHRNLITGGKPYKENFANCPPAVMNKTFVPGVV